MTAHDLQLTDTGRPIAKGYRAGPTAQGSRPVSISSIPMISTSRVLIACALRVQNHPEWSRAKGMVFTRTSPRMVEPAGGCEGGGGGGGSLMQPPS